MLGFKVSQATVSCYLSTLHRRSGQSWRAFIGNQALSFRYSDDLDYGNQDSQSPVDDSYRGKFTGPAERIVRPGADNRGTSHLRVIAIRTRWRTRGDRLRLFRFDRAPERSMIARANPLSVSVQMRGPPHSPQDPSMQRLAIGKWRGPGFDKRQPRRARSRVQFEDRGYGWIWFPDHPVIPMKLVRTESL